MENARAMTWTYETYASVLQLPHRGAWRRAGRLVVLTVAISACRVSTGLGPEDVELRLDRAQYVATPIPGSAGTRFAFPMVLTVENRTGRTLYLGRCFPDSRTPLYNLTQVTPSDRYGSAYTPIWACVGHDAPLILAPRGTRSDTLRITGPNRFPSGSSVGLGLLEGEVEVSLSVANCRGSRCAGGSARRLIRRFRVLVGTA